MSTRVELSGVEIVSANPASFADPFTLKVTLHVLENPPADPIDVKFTWSPIWDFNVDQELDELEVGPFSTIGKHEFVLECDPPSLDSIPDPTGPTALMVAFHYRGEEFLHLGFNVEVQSTLATTPDVYTDPSVLTRSIGRCFRKASSISWDAPPSNSVTAAAAAASSSPSPSTTLSSSSSAHAAVERPELTLEQLTAATNMRKANSSSNEQPSGRRVEDDEEEDEDDSDGDCEEVYSDDEEEVGEPPAKKLRVEN